MTKLVEIIDDNNYLEFLSNIKQDIQTSRIKVNLSVNKELIMLYWRIGDEIIKRQHRHGWGKYISEQLAQDLNQAFPDMKGFGKRNIAYMRTFAACYPDYEFTQQAAAQIPWGHNQVILDKIHSPETRLWYIQKTIENGWSRNVLVINITARSHLTLGAAQTNFTATLPKPQSDLAQALMKSEYNFEFLGLGTEASERHIELGLIDNIRRFLLELGSGFAFLGSQYRVELAGEEFFIDLLMYHVKLKCYIVIELKAGKFTPEHAGKLSFYVTAIDSELKDESDNQTIGILLCQSSNKLMVEYSLKHAGKPIVVSEYTTTKLPKDMLKYLPTPEQFQHILDLKLMEEREK